MWKWPLRLSGMAAEDGMDVKGLGAVRKLDTEEFEVLEDVHVEVAPAS